MNEKMISDKSGCYNNCKYNKYELIMDATVILARNNTDNLNKGKRTRGGNNLVAKAQSKNGIIELRK